MLGSAQKAFGTWCRGGGHGCAGGCQSHHWHIANIRCMRQRAQRFLGMCIALAAEESGRLHPEDNSIL